MLRAPELGPELGLLARPEPGRVELADLEAQQVLALRPVALGGARPLHLGARLAELREQAADLLAQVLGVGEPIEQLELARRLEQALVLVLAVDLDQVVAEPLEQPDRHRRVVGEGPVAPRAAELPAEDELAVVETEPRLVEQRRDRAAGLDVEDRLDGRRLGVGANDVALGARPPDQQDRVDQHGLAGARLAGEHVEPRGERHHDGLEDGEVADAQLPQHRARC